MGTDRLAVVVGSSFVANAAIITKRFNFLGEIVAGRSGNIGDGQADSEVVPTGAYAVLMIYKRAIVTRPRRYIHRASLQWTASLAVIYQVLWCAVSFLGDVQPCRGARYSRSDLRCLMAACNRSICLTRYVKKRTLEASGMLLHNKLYISS